VWLTGCSLPALSVVAEWIASEDLAYDVDTIKFSMTFPRWVLGYYCLSMQRV
jgi:hypothetical protein